MATFKNPNSPEQPQAGVYGWYAIHETEPEVCIYIGMAGKRKNMPIPKGTLFRGVSEVQRNTFTSDSPKYVSLDTDFIVGTAIRFFEAKGYRCEWRHLKNDPTEEVRVVEEERPILQHHANGRIKREFRLFKNERGYSKERRKTEEGVQEAEDGIFEQLDVVISERIYSPHL